MDTVANLDSWSPSRTLKQPTSQFSKASDGVRLNTGRVTGIGIEVTRREPTINVRAGGAGMGMGMGPQSGGGGGDSVPSPLSSNLNAFINSPPRTGRVDSGNKVPNR